MLFSKNTETMTLTVEGMHCVNCARKVTEALKKVKGVSAVEVSLEGKTAAVTGKNLDRNSLSAAVAAAGFKAE